MNPNPTISSNFLNSCNYGNNAYMSYTISGLSGNGPWAVSVTGPGAGLITIAAGNFSYSNTFTANVLGNTTYTIASIKVDQTVCIPTSPSSVTYNVKQWATPYINASSDGSSVFFNVASVAGATYQWYNGKPNIDGSGATPYSGATSFNFSGSGSFPAPNNIVGIRIVNAHCISNGAYNTLNGNRFRKGFESSDDTQVIYPNPASDLLNIKAPFDSYTVSISNIVGETVLSQKVEGNNATIDLSNLSSGSHIVKILGNDGLITKSLQIVK